MWFGECEVKNRSLPFQLCPVTPGKWKSITSGEKIVTIRKVRMWGTFEVQRISGGPPLRLLFIGVLPALFSQKPAGASVPLAPCLASYGMKSVWGQGGLPAGGPGLNLLPRSFRWVPFPGWLSAGVVSGPRLPVLIGSWPPSSIFRAKSGGDGGLSGFEELWPPTACHLSSVSSALGAPVTAGGPPTDSRHSPYCKVSWQRPSCYLLSPFPAASRLVLGGESHGTRILGGIFRILPISPFYTHINSKITKIVFFWVTRAKGFVSVSQTICAGIILWYLHICCLRLVDSNIRIFRNTLYIN